jgi:two-component system cell cycle response regulator
MARILVIEDNLANLELMTYLLNAFGHVPLTAPNGEQGLTMARREKLDLIVCDIQLPGIDGHTVAREVKADATLRAIPLVAVTAFAMVGDRDKVLRSGFDGYISKPIDPETFLAQIEAFLPSDPRSSPVAPAVFERQVIPAGTKQGTILVVDDRPVNLSLKRSILEPLGYVVITASCMGEALDLAHEAPLDLIVSDLSMSDGSGFDLIRAIKTEPSLKDIPFVLVTSTYCNEDARAKGLALGAARFLFRPIDPEELLAEINACVAERKKM